MLKIIWFILVYFFGTQLFAQNLIPNPGFEQCDKCDRNGFIELGIAYGANDPIDWNSATYGSPDIYGIFPRSGKRHGGFFVGFAKHEYLTNHFTECLKPDAKYQFSFWIRPSTGNINYIIDEIGVYIQKDAAVYPQAEPLKQLTPTFLSPDGDHINTSGYRKFTFEYIAKGGEDHFIVGRFRPLSIGDTLFIGSKRPPIINNEAIYYFVDDFEMINLTPPVDLLPSEISICSGETKFLNIPSRYDKAEITWSTGEKSTSIQVPADPIVTVEIKLNDNCQTILRDTCVIIHKMKDSIRILGPDIICLGDTIILNAICNACTDLIWSNKETSRSIQILEPGEYTLSANTVCGEVTTIKKINLSNIAISSFLEFPNIIAPEGEEINRSFKPYVKPDELNKLISIRFEVYNRWGKKVFESNDINNSWSPKTDAPMETYLYYCELEYQDCDRIRKTSLKGSVTLVR